MTLSIRDAFIRVDTAATDTGIDFEIPNDDIAAVGYDRRIQRRKDEGRIVLHNDAGQYSSGDRALSIGDRLEVFVLPEGAPDFWGGPEWGLGGYGGERRLWTAAIADAEYTRHSAAKSTLTLECVDWGFEMLSNRLLFDAFEDRPLSGSDDAILNTAVANKAPEVDLQAVEDVDVETSMTAEGTNLLEFVVNCAKRGDAVLGDIGRRLLFYQIDSVTPAFEVDPETDVGPVATTFDGDTIANSVRVEGGTDYALESEHPSRVELLSYGGTAAWSFRVECRKSALDRVEIWTNPISDADVTVRLQKDAGGSPIDKEDQNSDIDRRRLSHEFLADDGWTSFVFNDHTLPEPHPWVIIDVDGTQQFGVDNEGTPAWRAYFPYDIVLRQDDRESVREYTRREVRHQRDSIRSMDEARAVAQDVLGHEATPESDVELPALSRRMHRLVPGDVVTLDLPRERTVGDYMITETSQSFEDRTRMDTTHTATAVDSL